MKTIINNQQPLRCERQRQLFYSLRQSFFGLSSSLHAQKIQYLKQRLLLIASALRGIFVGLNALVNSASVNGRIFTGLAIAGVVAPGASCLHLLFDRKADLDFAWYHVNNYYLFNALGPYFSMAFLVIGIFLILPRTYKAQYWLSPFMGYPIIKSILIYFCESNEEWHYTVMDYHWSLLIAIVAIGLVVLLGIDHFTWRKYHSFDGKMSRLIGLVNISNLKPEEKDRLVNEIKKAQSFSF